MTYCVGIYLEDGLVLLSDSRTNAGVDHISTFSKMHLIDQPGDRSIAMMTAGNLAVSQKVVNLVTEGPGTGSDDAETLLTVPSMFRAAELVGAAIREVWEAYGEGMQAQSIPFDVSVLLAGQISGRRMRLFQIYAAGNFIEATSDTPFLQIGEHKYGKPILDRACHHDMAIEDAIKLAMISMDSTLRSNLSVGLPLDLTVYRKDDLCFDVKKRINDDDPWFQVIQSRWSDALRSALGDIPAPDMQRYRD